MTDERAKRHLVALALAETGGDVAELLPVLAEDFGLPGPEWSTEKGRYVFPWEEQDWQQRGKWQQFQFESDDAYRLREEDAAAC